MRHRYRATCLLFLTLFSTLSGASEYLNSGYGPLWMRSQNPGQAFRIALLPHDARGIPEGRHSFGVTNTTSNIWANSPEYKMDFHMNDLGLFYARGISERIWLAIALIDRRVVNAHLDQFVIDFHDALGLGQDGRLDVPKNDSRVSIPRYSVEMGKAELLNEPLSQSLNLLVGYKWLKPRRSGGVAVSSFFQYYREVGDESLTPRGSDEYGVGLSATLPRFGDYWYLNLGYSRLSEDELTMPVPVYQDQFSAMFGWENPLSPRSSLVVQYLADSGVIRNLGELSQTAHQVQVGWKRDFGGPVLELALAENLLKFYNSPDFSANVGLSYRF